MDLTIRMETPLEWEIVEKVVRDTFQTAEHTDHKEHHLVHRLRESPAFLPCSHWLAEKQGWIVGHVLFTAKVQVGGKILLALAPVSVLPEEQNQGIGSRLIQEGHKRAAARGISRCYCAGTCRLLSRDLDIGQQQSMESMLLFLCQIIVF